jgi:hypothetical protein
MKKLLVGSLLGLGLCAFTVSAEEITGYISDAHCGAKHHEVSEKNTKCVKDMCIKGGADPVLVSNGKVMKFDSASKEKATALAGENVKISGTVDGDTIKVDSIDKASE